MAITLDTPITIIEGVGEDYGAALTAAGLSTVTAFLANPLAKTLAALDGVSQERIAAWRRAGFLMFVEGVDHQLAEALVRAGVKDPWHLAKQQLSELRQLFSNAAEAGVIPAVPDDDTLCRMSRDAAIVAYSGNTAGVVLDGNGNSVEGAKVRVGLRQTKSDAAGRFRLQGIPLGRAPYAMSITAKGFVPRTVEDARVNADIQVLSFPSYALEAWVPTARAERRPRLQIRSELKGHVLPPMRGRRHLTVTQDPATLASGDILKLREVNRDARTGELVSRFRRYANGVFASYRYLVPLAMLGADPSLGDHFRVKKGQLVRITVDQKALYRWKIARQVQRKIAFQKLTPDMDSRAILTARRQMLVRAMRSGGVEE